MKRSTTWWKSTRRRGNRCQAARGFEWLEPRSLLATYSWVGGSNGNQWTEAANWFNTNTGRTNDGLPGPADTAVLNGGPSIASLGTDVTVGELTIDIGFKGMTLNTGANRLTVNGGAIRTGILRGNFSNQGTLKIEVPAEFADSSRGAPLLWGELRNESTVQHVAGILLTSQNLAPIGQIVNAEGARYELTGSGGLVNEWGVGSFLNQGLLEVNAPDSVAFMSTALRADGAGRVNVVRGTLSLRGAEQTLRGSIDVASGATLDVHMATSASIVAVPGDLEITGAGLLKLRQGTMTMAGGTLRSNEAEVRIESDAGAESHAATLQGFGTLEVVNFVLRRGRIGREGFGGTPSNHVFTNKGTVTVAGVILNESYLGNSTLINHGQIIMSEGGSGFALIGSAIDNRVDGILRFTKDASFNCAHGNGVGPSVLINAGTIATDEGITSVALPGIVFQNQTTGILDVRSGTFDLSTARHFNSQIRSFSTGGHFRIAAGAKVRLDEGLIELAGVYEAEGGGQVILGNTMLINAVLDFPHNMLRWDHGNLRGTFTNRGDMVVANDLVGTWNHFSGDATNEGTLRLLDNTVLNLSGGSPGGPGRVINAAKALVELGTGSVFAGTPVGPLSTDQFPVILNHGTLRLATGLATIQPKFENHGTVETGGVLTLVGARAQISGLPRSMLSGSWIVRDGGSIEFPRALQTLTGFNGSFTIRGIGSQIKGLDGLERLEGDIVLEDGATWNFPSHLTNAGTIRLDAGSTLRVAKNYQQSAEGTLDISVAGVNSVGKLQVVGNASLSGHLVTHLEPGFAAEPTQRFEVVSATQISGDFGQVSSHGLVASTSQTNVTLALPEVAADLLASAVVVSPKGTPIEPGTVVAVDYVVRNQSGQTIQDAWADQIFFSTDPQLDAADLVMTRVVYAHGLAAYGTAARRVTFSAPTGLGRGYLIVAADSAGSIFDINRRNNVSAATEPVEFAIPEIRLGESRVADIGSQPSYYRLTIPEGAGPVRLTATFAADNAGEIRVQRGELPRGNGTEVVANAKPLANDRTASIDLADGLPGVYYLSVTGATNGSVTLHADRMSLLLTSVDGNLSGQLVEGDSLTLTVRGTGFDSATQFRLGSLPASKIEVLDANSAVLTFANLPIGGPWNLSARNAASDVTLSQPTFLATTRPTDLLVTRPDWAVVLTMPSIVRPEREIPVTVTFTNKGRTSQPAPLIRLTTDNGQLRLAREERYGGSDYYVLGVKSTGRPDSYAPGESGQVKLFLFPTNKGAHIFSQVDATLLYEQSFQTLVASPTSSTTTRAIPIALSDAMLDSFRPSQMPMEAWETVVKPNFKRLVGDSLESFATAVRRTAAHLQRDGANTLHLARLVATLLNEADNFGSTSRRFRLTALGRGIENPFDIRLEHDAQGNATVWNGFRSRYFPRVGTAFESLPGDRGRLTTRAGGGWEVREADGSVTAFRADGLWESTSDPFGNRTTATYVDGRLVSTVNANGGTTLLEYAPNGRISKMTEQDGRVTTFAYDATGELLTSFTSPEGTTTLNYSGSRTGPQAFAVRSITSPGGTVLLSEYDDWGRLSLESGGGGALARRFTYGSAERMGEITITDAQQNTTTYVRGEFGQVSAIEDATGHSVDYEFDSRGRILEMKSETQDYRIERDSFGNPVRILGPRGDLLSATYDGAGLDATSLSDPLGRVTQLDVAGGLTTMQTLPDGSSTSYAYDARGYLTIVQTQGGHWSRQTIDSHGLLTRVEYSDGSVTDYSYDARRNLTQVKETSPSGTIQTIAFALDDQDRVTRVTDAANRWIDYGYDANGSLVHMATFDGQTTDYEYDSLNRTTAVRFNGEVMVRYEYDALGRLARKLFANDNSTHYSYDAAGRIVKLEHRYSDGRSLDFVEYTYDAAGHVASATTPTGKQTYAYDGWGQLVSVTLPDATTRRYDTDAAGNRTGYQVNATNQYLAAPDGRQFVYDLDGNLSVVSHPDGTLTRYTYDDRNRVRSMHGPEGTTTFEYDALGNRSAVVQNGVRTEYLFDPLGYSDRLAEYVNGTRSASYLLAGGLEGRFDANNAGSFYHFDAIGNTLALTSSDGSLAASYAYTPFGEVTRADGSEADRNPFRFNGRTGAVSLGGGIYDMRARLYDSSSGRFTQLDPSGFAGQDTNWYRFAHNNPLSYIDPTGHQPVIPPVDPNPKPGDRPPDPQEPRPKPTKVDPPPQPQEPYDPDKKPTEYVPDPDRDDDTELPYQPQISREPADRARVRLDRLKRLEDRLDQEQRNADASLLLWGSLIAISGAGLVVVSGGGLAPWLAPAGSGATTSTVIAESAPLVGRVLIPTVTVIGASTSAQAEQQTPIDPNEIVGPEGYGLPGYRQAVGDYDYTIFFQNKPDAAVPAQEVTLTQNLDPDLDWDSFQLARFGWAGKTFEVPAGLQSYTTHIEDAARGVVVEISAKFNAANGQLLWKFRSLDPVTFDLPFEGNIGFLPPDDATGVGQGFVSYQVRPRVDAVTGTEYRAQASIVFDTEAPLATNIYLNTADMEAPDSVIQSLPEVTRNGRLTISWLGNDGALGSGIAAYRIYLARDSEPFALLAEVPPSVDQWTLDVTDGHRYAFYSVAVDHAGHVESPPSQVDALTTVSLEGSAPSSRVGELPRVSPLEFNVTWSSETPVTSWDIYVIDNDEPPTIWLAATTLTTASYQGEEGHVYGFFSVAQDAAGNTEGLPASVDATTTARLRPWQNSRNPLDVNADGHVSPIDALLVINQLNTFGAAALPAPALDRQPAPFLDVSGDGFVSPRDALDVINELNRGTTAANVPRAAVAQPALPSSHLFRSAQELRWVAAAIDRVFENDDSVEEELVSV